MDSKPGLEPRVLRTAFVCVGIMVCFYFLLYRLCALLG